MGQIVCKLPAKRCIEARSSIENEKLSPGPERTAACGRHTQAESPRKEEKRKEEILQYKKNEKALCAANQAAVGLSRS